MGLKRQGRWVDATGGREIEIGGTSFRDSKDRRLLVARLMKTKILNL
jgi:hypothetical protein